MEQEVRGKNVFSNFREFAEEEEEEREV